MPEIVSYYVRYLRICLVASFVGVHIKKEID